MTPEEIIAAEAEPQQVIPAEESPVAEEIPVEEAPVAEEISAEEAPAEEAPAQQPAPKKKIKKKRHIAVRILCGFLGTILVILMIIPALLGLTVANLQNITSQNTISQILGGILTASPVAAPFPALSAPLAGGIDAIPGGTIPGDLDIGDLTGENSTDFVVDFV